MQGCETLQAQAIEEDSCVAYDADKHHRRSIRLRNYDYAEAGAYFVTLCVEGRACLFGDIVDEDIRLNDIGCMVRAAWEGLPSHYPGVEIDAFVVMPNHVHGIIVLAPDCAAGMALGDVVRRFKMLTTKRYADGVRQHGWRWDNEETQTTRLWRLEPWKTERRTWRACSEDLEPNCGSGKR